jgi:hypothetical protein
MQTENKILIVDYLADPKRNDVPLLINIPDTEAEVVNTVPETPRVTVKKSRHVRSEKQQESFNKVLFMMEVRRRKKRELKEEAIVNGYFERKLNEMNITDEEEAKAIVKNYFNSLTIIPVREEEDVAETKTDVEEES